MAIEDEKYLNLWKMALDWLESSTKGIRGTEWMMKPGGQKEALEREYMDCNLSLCDH